MHLQLAMAHTHTHTCTHKHTHTYIVCYFTIRTDMIAEVVRQKAILHPNIRILANDMFFDEVS